jgi:hypothetical protein
MTIASRSGRLVLGDGSSAASGTLEAARRAGWQGRSFLTSQNNCIGIQHRDLLASHLLT